MLEGTPGSPYGAKLKDLLTVEANMIYRRQESEKYLADGDILLTITSFPFLGCNDFLNPPYFPKPESGSSRSLFIPEEAINPFPRFPTLTANIRERRGGKVSINIPIFHDENTPRPFKEPVPPSLRCLCAESIKSTVNICASVGCTADSCYKEGGVLPSLPDLLPDAKPDHIYMDAMCFGMGCSCLQITFQACSIEEARRLYDHLSVVSPIMVCISETHSALIKISMLIIVLLKTLGFNSPIILFFSLSLFIFFRASWH